jgi:lipopolysaccharide export system permease protein
MLIFIFQSIWLFIDELAGKGLDFIIIGKFLFYYAPNLVPNVLPLTVLLASIMTFGAFAENYEFAAMKSAGISLQRAMRSLIVFILFLSVATFYFANNVIPQAEYKSYNLRRNIAKLKPALAITEGVFNDIGNMNIKVDEKYGDNDRYLKGVILHKKSTGGVNKTVIKATSGELASSEKSDILQLILRDGAYYEEVGNAAFQKTENTYPHAKAHFEIYRMNVDLRELNKLNMEEDNISTYKMLNVKELKYAIDSISKGNREIITDFAKSLYNRMDITSAAKTPTVDSSPEITPSPADPYQATRTIQVLDAAIRDVTSTITLLERREEEFAIRDKFLNHHIMAWHGKFALAFGCIILFFVGAPLGAIIRKGGMGLPMVLAIILFLTYYFIGIFAKNYAENGSISPVLGSWVSTLIMLPLGIILTRRATADKNIFSVDSFTEALKNFFKKKRRANQSPPVNL